MKKTGTQLMLHACILAGILVLSSGFTGIDFTKQPELLQQQIERYQNIRNKGGWQKITLLKSRYKKGDRSTTILQLKKRLQTSGDFTQSDTTDIYSEALEDAVKKVQRRFGFAENGVIEASFVLALNVPVEERLAQLQVNLERTRAQITGMAPNRIVVNIPEYKLSVYENNAEVLTINAVVGKESTKTAVFNGSLTNIVFSPYWNVPPSIVQKEILPAMRRNRHYLASHGYEITGYEDGLPVIRQRPGGSNALGKVKFLFPNSHAIYFHDTPAKTLFKNRIRAYSHGCIRLEEPEKLAAYLLRNNPDWTEEKIFDAMNASSEQWVKLPEAIPVYITYFTAWVDEEGQMNFRDDIYNEDKALLIAGNL